MRDLFQIGNRSALEAFHPETPIFRAGRTDWAFESSTHSLEFSTNKNMKTEFILISSMRHLPLAYA